MPLAGTRLAIAPARAADGEVPSAYGRMLLVLDSSGSMAEPSGGGTTRIAAAKRALTQVVRQLPEQSEVGLRVYGATVFDKDHEDACTDSQLAVPPGTGNRGDLLDAIGAVKPYGETPIAYALRRAADDVGDGGMRSVVLVSDGIATCAPDPCKVAAELASSGVDLHIDVVGLSVSGGARQQLQCIAEQGKGTYYNADSAADIVKTLTRVSQRAVRPFRLAGTPVEGSRTAADAPTITAGQWTDVVGGKGSPDATRHFRVRRTMPGSTIHVTATTRGTVGKWDQIGVTLTGPDGSECDKEDDYRDIDQYSILSTEVVSGRDVPYIEDDCWQGDSLEIAVERGNFEDTRSAPFSLTVFEEPPATGVEQLPEWQETGAYVAPSVPGRAHRLVAGSGFADAPRIGTGRYALDIVPGESQIVRVPLDWGQQLTVRARFPAGTPGVEDLTGIQGPFGDLKLYTSLLGTMSAYASGTDNTSIMPGLRAGELTAMSPTVRYRNREAYGDGQPVLPGDHYVVVSMNADSDGDTWVQPYTLEVEVLGEPAGAPAYEGDAEVTQPLDALAVAQAREAPTSAPTGPTAAGGPAGSAAEADRPADDGLSAGLVGAVSLGLVVLLLVLLLLVRRRRA
nr:VWA domain-containing protein [Nocardioides panaciterrulae]